MSNRWSINSVGGQNNQQHKLSNLKRLAQKLQTEAGEYIGVTLGQAEKCGGFIPPYESQAPRDPQLLISRSAIAKQK